LPTSFVSVYPTPTLFFSDFFLEYSLHPMKRKARGSLGFDSAAGQQGVAAMLLEDMASEFSLLRPYLSTSDIFSLRRTCKDAWKVVKHRVLHRDKLFGVATADRHVPLIHWGLDAKVTASKEDLRCIGRLGSTELVARIVPLYPHRYVHVLQGLVEGGHDALFASVFTASSARDAPLHCLHDVLDAIASRGSLSLAQMVVAEAEAWKPFAVQAMASGNLAFARWVLGEDPQLSDDALCVSAAKSGSIELVAWLAEHGCAVDHPGVAGHAAMGGHIPLLQWLVNCGYSMDVGVFESAVFGNQVETMEWIWQRGVELNESSIRTAADYGHLAALQWLVAHQCPRDEELVARRVAGSGATATLRWWIGQGFAWSADACAAAAAASTWLDTIRFLHEEHGVLDATLPDRAARWGNLDVLRYAVRHGLHLTIDGCIDAVEFEHLMFLRYVFERGLFTMNPELLEFVSHPRHSKAHDLFRELGFISWSHGMPMVPIPSLFFFCAQCTPPPPPPLPPLGHPCRLDSCVFARRRTPSRQRQIVGNTWATTRNH
jgi:hypothetical protein